MDYTVLGLGALEQGFIYAIMAIGVFIALRILDIPDLTCDGSFITGAAVSVMITLTGHPYLSLLLAILAGGIAGIMTGLMITKLNVQPLLAGIITMTGLFSINLIIMDEKPTVSINDKNNIFSFFFDFFSFGRKLDPIQRKLITIPVLFVIVLIISIALIWFLKTKTGLALRATGDNEAMVKASSINADAMKILGLALANGVIALSGAVLSQHQNFADAKAGTGMVVVGIASIIIGEALFGRQSLLNNLVSAILGAMIYRIFISLALQFGLPASYFKLLSAFIVVFALLIPLLKSKMIQRSKRKNG